MIKFPCLWRDSLSRDQENSEPPAFEPSLPLRLFQETRILVEPMPARK
jgi:hypothetical protein